MAKSSSTDLVRPDSFVALQAPDTLDLVKDSLAGGTLNEFDLKRVKMAAGGATFWEVPTYTGDTEPVQEVAGVLLAVKNARTYWEEEYTGAGNPPDCASRDAQHARPRQVNDDPVEPEYFQPPAQKIGDDGLQPVYSCDSCQFSQWGTQVRKGKRTRGQACKLTRQLFILGPETRLPMVVNLPPTSLKPAAAYLLNLVDYGVDYRGVVTHLRLEKVQGKGVPDYARAVFRAGEALTPEQTMLARRYSDLLAPAFAQIIPDADEAGVVDGTIDDG